MNTQTTIKSNKKLPLFKKTVVGILVLSSVTVGLLELEKYRSNREAVQFSQLLSQYQTFEHEDTFNNSEMTTEQIEADSFAKASFYGQHENDSLYTTDIAELTELAEQNLIAHNQTNINTINSTELNPEVVDDVILNSKVDVLFALSSSTISPEYKLLLVDIADYMKQHTEEQWQVVGRTDKSGRAAYNLALSKQRAENVMQFLIEEGVKEDQLRLTSLGEYEATQLKHSTYNVNLRSVEISPYDAHLAKLKVNAEKQARWDEHLAALQQEALITEPTNVAASETIEPEVILQDEQQPVKALNAQTEVEVINENSQVEFGVPFEENELLQEESASNDSPFIDDDLVYDELSRVNPYSTQHF